MKQLAIGLIEYAQDYDEKWPEMGSGGHWASQIYMYEKSTGVYKCPEDHTDADPPRYPISYAMNGNLRGQPQSGLTEPAATVLAVEFDGTPPCDFTVAEKTSMSTTGVSPNTAWGGIRLGTVSTTANPPRHDPSVMFLGCDGHVKLLRPEKVSSGADNAAQTGTQDRTQAAGTSSTGTSYTLTFSEI